MKRIIISTISAFALFSCSLQPLKWQPLEKPTPTETTKKNNLLSAAEHLDLQGWYGPEDIAIDQEGNIYTGVHIKKTDFTSGTILKITPSGNVTQFCNTKSWVTGLHFDAEGYLIACDTKNGLTRISPTGEKEILVTHSEKDVPIRLPNDVDIDQNGIIYFSSTSSRYPFSTKNARRIILEARPDGGLYSYNPHTKAVKTLIDSSFFGNGVAVSQQGDFVLMVDLTKYRVLRYWLKGEKAGKTDVFINNLPGLPNGISRRSDGSFWLGFTTRRSDALDRLQPHPKLKQFVFALPQWLQPKQEPYGLIMNLSETGQVLKTYHDPTGKVVSEASSIEEYEGHLYIGGDLIDHINRFKLPNY